MRSHEPLGEHQAPIHDPIDAAAKPLDTEATTSGFGDVEQPGEGEDVNNEQKPSLDSPLLFDPLNQHAKNLAEPYDEWAEAHNQEMPDDAGKAGDLSAAPQTRSGRRRAPKGAGRGKWALAASGTLVVAALAASRFVGGGDAANEETHAPALPTDPTEELVLHKSEEPLVNPAKDKLEEPRDNSVKNDGAEDENIDSGTNSYERYTSMSLEEFAELHNLKTDKSAAEIAQEYGYWLHDFHTSSEADELYQVRAFELTIEFDKIMRYVVPEISEQGGKKVAQEFLLAVTMDKASSVRSNNPDSIDELEKDWGMWLQTIADYPDSQNPDYLDSLTREIDSDSVTETGFKEFRTDIPPESRIVEANPVVDHPLTDESEDAKKFRIEFLFEPIEREDANSHGQYYGIKFIPGLSDNKDTGS